MTEKAFLSIKEASKLSGKSESTIKRMIKKIIKDGRSNKDSKVDQKVKKEKAAKGYFWFIAEDVLNEHITTNKPQTNDKDLTIQILHEQLKTKDEQLAQLLERQRETNILTKQLQDRVFLLESGDVQTTPKRAAADVSYNKPQETKTKKTTAKPKATKPPKKGFWGRFFS